MSTIVDKVLEQWGLTSDHRKAQDTIPAYAFKMEELITRLSPPPPPPPPPPPKQKTLDEIVKDLNKKWTQTDLFTDDQIPEKSVEELVAALEAALQAAGMPPVLFSDGEVEVTLRGALKSRPFWERALKAIDDWAAHQKLVAHKLLRCTKIAMEILRRNPWKE